MIYYYIANRSNHWTFFYKNYSGKVVFEGSIYMWKRKYISVL